VRAGRVQTTLGTSTSPRSSPASSLSAERGPRHQALTRPRRAQLGGQQDVPIALTGKLLLIHGEMDDQVHPDHTLRLADRLIAADKDFELLIVPGAEHTFIDRLAYVRKRCWDFLVRELMARQHPPTAPPPSPSTPNCSVNSPSERHHISGAALHAHANAKRDVHGGPLVTQNSDLILRIGSPAAALPCRGFVAGQGTPASAPPREPVPPGGHHRCLPPRVGGR
jgi:hypothetical protein